MKKNLLLAVLIFLTVLAFSKDKTFTDKYFELRNFEKSDEIQIYTIPGKHFSDGLKDSIKSKGLSKSDQKQINSFLNKIDQITIVADSNMPAGIDSSENPFNRLIEEQEELMAFNLGGVMNVVLLSDGQKKSQSVSLFCTMGEASDFTNTSNLSISFAGKAIKLAGNRVCMVLCLTFNKPVSEQEIMGFIKNAKLFSSEKESLENKMDSDQTGLSTNSSAATETTFSLLHKGKVLYFRGVESNILDSINKEANFFAYKNVRGTTLTAPPDGSKYQGDLEIPSQVEQNGVTIPVVCIDVKAFKGSEITSIILPESLLSIERHAFEDCINLQSIVIPNQVKSISTAAFQGCKKLEHVTLSSNLHSLGGFSFNGCSALETVILPNSLKMIGEYAFAVCGFKSFHFNQVKNLANGVLSNCSNLETVTIPKGVVSINKNVLFNNPKLKKILVETTEPPFVDGIFYWNKEQVNVFIPATAMDAYKSTPFWKDLKLNSY